MSSTTQTQQYAPEDTILVTNHDADSPNTGVTRVVVIAIDQSKYSQFAFDWAVKNFLRKESDLVVLVNVRPIETTPIPYDIGPRFTDFNEIAITLDDQKRKSQSATRIRVKTKGGKPIALRGDARDEIVRKVSELNADGLILGSRGLGAVKRMLLGSVSDHCVHNCHCTVIIVREDTGKKSK
ncbi:7085_t:CDS:2 [Diversispora eburnea]|uniref:7085_t:CDS:1 n=1 Tax=Diversispora eburnea TaxID=1213867 RepID=A0A9N9A1L5_9GLOM|nr:7085_t:CDS:2 [Diversispora eburnea]